MALIIQLEEVVDAVEPRVAPIESGHSGGGAEVIIFPGIRYERWDDASDDCDEDFSGRSVERDWLEI